MVSSAPQQTVISSNYQKIQRLSDKGLVSLAFLNQASPLTQSSLSHFIANRLLDVLIRDIILNNGKELVINEISFGKIDLSKVSFTLINSINCLQLWFGEFGLADDSLVCPISTVENHNILTIVPHNTDLFNIKDLGFIEIIEQNGFKCGNYSQSTQDHGCFVYKKE